MSTTCEKYRELVSTYKRWFHSTRLGPLRFILASVAASNYDEKPIWPMLIGPPGCGKTELLYSLRRIPKVHQPSTFNPASFISGTPKEKFANGAKGGLLFDIGVGNTGFIVLKDFGNILAMKHDTRAEVMQIIRELYDGSYTRPVGTNGGKEIHWHGKVVFISAATNAFDVLQGDLAALGERFIYYRIKNGSDEAERQGRGALDNFGRETRMQRELADRVADLFDPFPVLPDLADQFSDEQYERILALAQVAARGRSSVARDRRYRDICSVDATEAPTRLVKSLAMLFGGMLALGIDEHSAWEDISQVALDSLPPIRRMILVTIADYKQPADIKDIHRKSRLNCSMKTLERALQDLEVHKLVRHIGEVKGDQYLWEPTPWLAEKYQTAGLEDFL
jgi:hypothetical protein